jgi:hypothetical protein
MDSFALVTRIQIVFPPAFGPWEMQANEHTAQLKKCLDSWLPADRRITYLAPYALKIGIVWESGLPLWASDTGLNRDAVFRRTKDGEDRSLWNG